MIGHYLLTLTPEQEDRVLTEPFEPFSGSADVGCLVQIAVGGGISAPRACEITQVGAHRAWVRSGPRYDKNRWIPGNAAACYDMLGRRFGTERVNAAIRNRILSNQARRTLRHAPQLEAV